MIGTAGKFQKSNLDVRTLKKNDMHAIKFCFKLGKMATEKYGMLQTAFGSSWMNQSSVFE